jgi:hypothetical protein
MTCAYGRRLMNSCACSFVFHSSAVTASTPLQGFSIFEADHHPSMTYFLGSLNRPIKRNESLSRQRIPSILYEGWGKDGAGSLYLAIAPVSPLSSLAPHVAGPNVATATLETTERTFQLQVRTPENGFSRPFAWFLRKCGATECIKLLAPHDAEIIRQVIAL